MYTMNIFIFDNYIKAVNCTDDPVPVTKNGTDRGTYNWDKVSKMYKTSVLYEYVYWYYYLMPLYGYI